MNILIWESASIDRKSSNLKVGFGFHGSGSLHTQAKSRDHKNCESPKELFKCCPKTLPKPWSVVTCPQV